MRAWNIANVYLESKQQQQIQHLHLLFVEWKHEKPSKTSSLNYVWIWWSYCIQLATTLLDQSSWGVTQRSERKKPRPRRNRWWWFSTRKAIWNKHVIRIYGRRPNKQAIEIGKDGWSTSKKTNGLEKWCDIFHFQRKNTARKSDAEKNTRTRWKKVGNGKIIKISHDKWLALFLFKCWSILILSQTPRLSFLKLRYKCLKSHCNNLNYAIHLICMCHQSVSSSKEAEDEGGEKKHISNLYLSLVEYFNWQYLHILVYLWPMKN